MIHPDMPAAEYHALPAVSASMLINCHKKCPAYAWAYSSLNPRRLAEKPKREFNHGIAVHLAALQPDLLEAKLVVIEAHDYKTKAAQEKRDAAYAEGKTPILWKHRMLVAQMADALRRSDAHELLFGEGRSEVSYTWDVDGWGCPKCGGSGSGPGNCTICGASKVPGLQGKARVDRLQGAALIDLKTAESASPEAFDGTVLAYGHHQRAAWYKDGFRQKESAWIKPKGYEDHARYFYVVVENDPPHLVGVYECSERAEEWGRRINHAMLTEVREGLKTGKWSGYGGGVRELRSWVEHQYAEREEEGKL